MSKAKRRFGGDQLEGKVTDPIVSLGFVPGGFRKVSIRKHRAVQVGQVASRWSLRRVSLPSGSRMWCQP